MKTHELSTKFDNLKLEYIETIVDLLKRIDKNVILTKVALDELSDKEVQIYRSRIRNEPIYDIRWFGIAVYEEWGLEYYLHSFERLEDGSFEIKTREGNSADLAKVDINTLQEILARLEMIYGNWNDGLNLQQYLI